MSFVDVLVRSCDLQVLNCGQMRLAAPWALRKEASPHAGFLYVMDGTCVVQLDGESDQRKLLAGDFLFFTRFVSHNLGDSLNRAAVPFDDPSVPQINSPGVELNYGGLGHQTRLYLARLAFSAKSSSLLKLLPPAIQSTGQSRLESPWLRRSIECMMSRASIERPGGRVMLKLLATQLFVQAVRSASDTSRYANLLSLSINSSDSEIAHLVEALHQSPEKGWNLTLMAEEAKMSRAAFAAHFRATVGTTPSDYLARLRIGNAEELLATGMSVKQVARAVGYRSATAFARSFKRITKVAPSAYRDGIHNP